MGEIIGLVAFGCDNNCTFLNGVANRPALCLPKSRVARHRYGSLNSHGSAK